jgi:hypothetical protein
LVNECPVMQATRFFASAALRLRMTTRQFRIDRVVG